jgi:hypothetical protein
VPPPACKGCEYTLPTASEGRFEEVIVSGVGTTTILPAACADWAGLLLSLTVAEKAEVPLAVVVPEITPVGDRAKPAGRLPEPTDQL